MKDSISFPLLLATVFVGALLAVFDPANRKDATAAEATTTLSPVSTPSGTLASNEPS